MEEYRRHPSKRPKLGAGAGGSGGDEKSVPSALEKSVSADAQKCVQIADEKVALAKQCYDLVDAHISKLDKAGRGGGLGWGRITSSL